MLRISLLCSLAHLTLGALWPSVETSMSFQGNVSLYTVDGQYCGPLQNTTGVMYVDALKRNKVIVKSTTQVPLFGSISIDLLIDYNKGTILTYTPQWSFLLGCQLDNFTKPFNLSKELAAAYD